VSIHGGNRLGANSLLETVVFGRRAGLSATEYAKSIDHAKISEKVITEEEQMRYRNMCVGIAGLSVGSAILSAIVRSGGPKFLKIADFDSLEVSNLNRVNASVLDIGKSKAEVAARYVWELDPFAKLAVYKEGLAPENVQNFILGEPKIDIFIDEMDSLDVKLYARAVCREHSIPVLMGTDCGEKALIDVERYDMDPAYPFFHGRAGPITPEEVRELPYAKWLETVNKIIGIEYLAPRMQESIREIGASIAGVPQLGTTAALVGSGMATLVRRIANNEPVASARYVIDMEGVFAKA